MKRHCKNFFSVNASAAGGAKRLSHLQGHNKVSGYKNCLVANANNNLVHDGANLSADSENVCL